MKFFRKLLKKFTVKQNVEVVTDKVHQVSHPPTLMDDTSYLIKKVTTLYPRQKELYDMMMTCNKLQICLPTGVGKNYLMRLDLLRRLLDGSGGIFVISTHRLMLNTQHIFDIFDTLQPKLGQVGFVFVGSKRLNLSHYSDNTKLQTKLLSMGLNRDDLFSSNESKQEMEETINRHKLMGRSVVIITTYHSLYKLSDLEIDTIYCDEAHTLASKDETLFKDNFLGLNFKNSYFFTATPKDCEKDTDLFLMNNVKHFGERVGFSFKESVELGFIVQPQIHIALPSDYDPSINYKSISNKVKIIIESFAFHKKSVMELTYDKNKISPKILVKCSSVDEMWALQNELVKQMKGVTICCGATRSGEGDMNLHRINSTGISDRDEYLKIIQNFSDNEEVIVLHYDILSEGINVPGFTGVMFLSGSLPTMPKTLQNLGRSTRLHPYDRMRLEKGEISTNDLTNWVKPYCSIIIPYWDNESEMTKSELCDLIRKLRDEFDFHPVFKITIGDDMGKSSQDDDDLPILNPKKKRELGFEIIKDIRHEIEKLDRIRMVNKMSDVEWDSYVLDNILGDDQDLNTKK